MKYYQISRSAEPNIIGIKTGTSQVELDEDAIEKNQNYKDFKSFFNGHNQDFWHLQSQALTLNPPILKGKMRKNAKITDIMEYGPVFSFLYNLVSEKYFEIVKKFNVDKCKVFDFDIENISQKYYLMFTQYLVLEEIDFAKSIITTGYKQLNNIKYHPIKNKKEFIEFKELEPISSFEKLSIPKKYADRDIISIQTISKQFYSEQLIDALLKENITGLHILYKDSININFI